MKDTAFNDAIASAILALARAKDLATSEITKINLGGAILSVDEAAKRERAQ
jgi:hypothetical protein